MYRQTFQFACGLLAATALFIAPLQAQLPDPPATPAATQAPAPLGASAGVSTPPSMTRPAAAASRAGELPRDANQIYVEYNLAPYTQYLKTVDGPEVAVLDWILRETGGNDVWFRKPFGFMSAGRSKISVYHTPEIQKLVKGMVERFVQGPTDAQMLRLRLMTVANPNWRSRALPLIQDFAVKSPGVQGWLVTKENAAVLTSLLRARTDSKELQNLSLPIHNGQIERLEQTKRRNYVKTIRQATTVWPPYEPEIGELKEGYELQISPLLDSNGMIDCVVKASIDQVDRLVPVGVELPLPNGQAHRTRIEVPQVVSWRLDERFRWDQKMVLVLSCGVIASPDRSSSSPLLNLDRLVGNTPGRADALLFIEYAGRAAAGLDTPRVANPNVGISRGRY